METTGEVDVRCTWVPGTMDRVRLHNSESPTEMDLERFQVLAGRKAVHALYLNGHVEVSAKLFAH